MVLCPPHSRHSVIVYSLVSCSLYLYPSNATCPHTSQTHLLSITFPAHLELWLFWGPKHFIWCLRKSVIKYIVGNLPLELLELERSLETSNPNLPPRMSMLK